MVVLYIFFIILAVSLIHFYIKTNKAYEEEKKQKRQERTERFRREAKEQELAKESVRRELAERFGECSREIEFPSRLAPIYNTIRIFEGSKTIMIQDKPYKFSDILEHQLRDDSHTVTSGGHYTEKSNTLGTVGRAVVGGVVAGGVGAVIGGMTGKKKGTVEPSVSKTVHNYTLYIHVKDFKNPIIAFKLGENHKLAEEIMGVLDIISADNK